MLGEESSPTAARGARQPACCVRADGADKARLAYAVVSSASQPWQCQREGETPLAMLVNQSLGEMFNSSELLHVHLQGESCGDIHPGPAHPSCQTMSNMQATYDALWQLVRIRASWRRGKTHEALLPSPAARGAGAAQLSQNGHEAGAVSLVPAVADHEPRNTAGQPGFAALPAVELIFRKLALLISQGFCLVGFPLL